LVALTASNAQPSKHPYPGLKDHRIGVGQTGEGNGEPCARINKDLGQSLTLSLTGALSGAVIDYAEIDLGFKFNGTAELIFRLGGPTGTVVDTEEISCTGGSDCGPDSGADDNERVVVYVDPSDAPGEDSWVAVQVAGVFDTITFQPKTPSNGSISLEGGNDGADPGPSGSLYTIFNTVEEFDGELGCTAEDNTVTFGEGDVSGSFTRLENRDGSTCVLKPFKIDVISAEDTVSFFPEDAPGTAPQEAAYSAELTFSPNTAFDGELPVITLEYDQLDDGIVNFEDVPWCTGDPFASPDSPGSIDSSVIPAGHTWCIISANTVVFDATQTQTTWSLAGIGDPITRVR
jgi:hypothetical protein